jgi:superfamily II DNA/RNA helicase
VSKVLLFDDTQRSVERLSKELIDRGFKADAIHGGKSQGQRQRALRRFRDSEVKVLVATDVAARGIDVADVSHVINYSQPQSYDDYVHRIGRAGRAGRSGFAYTFVSAT